MCHTRFPTARGHSIASVAQRWHARCTRPLSRATARVAMARLLRCQPHSPDGCHGRRQQLREVQLDCGRRAGSRPRCAAAVGGSGHRLEFLMGWGGCRVGPDQSWVRVLRGGEQMVQPLSSLTPPLSERAATVADGR